MNQCVICHRDLDEPEALLVEVVQCIPGDLTDSIQHAGLAHIHCIVSPPVVEQLPEVDER